MKLFFKFFIECECLEDIIANNIILKISIFFISNGQNSKRRDLLLDLLQTLSEKNIPKCGNKLMKLSNRLYRLNFPLISRV